MEGTVFANCPSLINDIIYTATVRIDGKDYSFAIGILFIKLNLKDLGLPFSWVRSKNC